MSTNGLFSEFAPTSAEQWIQQVVKDLKGADFNDKLVYESPEGIVIKPFYTQEDLAKYNQKTPLFTFTDWDITAEIDGTNVSSGNKKALQALNSGASALLFFVSHDCKIDVLLNDIGIEYITIQFVVEGDAAVFTHNLNQHLNTKQYNPSTLKISINTDPIEQLLRIGDWRKSEQEDKTELLSVLTDYNTLCINSNVYHNAGAPPAYEIACTLAHANTYINWLIESQKLKANDTLAIQLNIAVGPNYFFEIAKLRALRQVFALLFSEYNVKGELRIHAETAFRNLTVFDTHANLLRTTTAAMSASIGGCNSLVVKPFDSVYATTSELSERLALNTQLILKNESYFDKVADVSAGSFFIEELTEQLAEKAWTYFVAIEQRGGFLSALQSGTVQQQIETFAATQQQLFDEGKEVLIGTNKFPNTNEQKEAKGIVYGQASKQGKTIRTLSSLRLSAQNEQERLNKQTI